MFCVDDHSATNAASAAFSPTSSSADRPQLPREEVEIAIDAGRDLVDRLEPPAKILAVAFAVLQRADVQAQRGQLLAEMIVQVARDAAALVFLHRDQPIEQRLDALERHAALELQQALFRDVDDGGEQPRRLALALDARGEPQHAGRRGIGFELEDVWRRLRLRPAGAEKLAQRHAMRGMGDGEQRQPIEERSLVAKQRRTDQVDVGNRAGAIEREVADRREVVEVGVAIARVLELGLGLLELFVLGVDLLTVHLQLVEE